MTVTCHWLFHYYNYVVLLFQDTGNNYHSFQNKNKIRLHMFVLNFLLNVTCSQYRCSVFVCTNTRDSPLLCHRSASVRQHCHSPSLAYLHVPLNIASPIMPCSTNNGTVNKRSYFPLLYYVENIVDKCNITNFRRIFLGFYGL
jgi:hypothetical protein